MVPCVFFILPGCSFMKFCLLLEFCSIGYHLVFVHWISYVLSFVLFLVLAFVCLFTPLCVFPLFLVFFIWLFIWCFRCSCHRSSVDLHFLSVFFHFIYNPRIATVCWDQNYAGAWQSAAEILIPLVTEDSLLGLTVFLRVDMLLNEFWTENVTKWKGLNRLKRKTQFPFLTVHFAPLVRWGKGQQFLWLSKPRLAIQSISSVCSPNPNYSLFIFSKPQILLKGPIRDPHCVQSPPKYVLLFLLNL